MEKIEFKHIEDAIYNGQIIIKYLQECIDLEVDKVSKQFSLTDIQTELLREYMTTESLCTTSHINAARF